MIKYIFAVREREYEDCRKWCITTFGINYWYQQELRVWFSSYFRSVYFRNEKDAMLFRLRWSTAIEKVSEPFPI